MYALVKFTEDNVYHVCNAASVRICFDDVHAKWTNGRLYWAKLIVQHANNKHLLNELKQNLECNCPIVVLSSIFNNLSYPQHNLEAICGLTNDLVESGTVSHSDIYGTLSPIVDLKLLPSTILAQPDSELNEASIDNTENTANVEAIWGLSNGLVETESVSHFVIYAQPHSELNEASTDYTADTTNIEPSVVESGIFADVEIEFIDYLPNGDGILHLNSSIDSQCSLVVSTPSEISKGNDVQYHNEDHAFDLSFENPGFEKDNSFLVEENQQHFQNNAGINNAENVPEEKNQNRSQQNKKRSFPPYNREVVLTPSVTERTLQDGSTVVVSSATETKRRYFCIYCKQLYAKFPQHLQISHRDETAVKMFMQLPPIKRYDAAVKDLATLLTPTKFDVCVRAIKDVGGLNNNCTTFKAPTTVLTLSTICKQAAEVWKAECIKNNYVLGKRDTEGFLTLFKVTFPAELANTAIENRVQQQRKKVVKLPLKDDIKQLVAFLRRNRREWFLKVRNETSNLNYAL
ncbi:hypothetical protein FQR65_LT19681 [Abscondita terminalis]|nr:hypothetical protein FQR65_LT19681 [Abscondita terminalis]